MKKIPIQPIGVVRNSLGRRHYDEWHETQSDIIISKEYQDALYRLEEYSHIEVLFYLYDINRPFVTRIHPTGNPDYPYMGAFATRTPNRPSKIGLTICKLLSVDGNVLHVRGLDAYDGSPVLDIKPVTWRDDIEVRVPQWITDLKQKLSQE